MRYGASHCLHAGLHFILFQLYFFMVRLSKIQERRVAIKTRAHVVKSEVAKPAPHLVEFTDLNTGKRSSVATPGGMGRMIGNRLKVDPTEQPCAWHIILGHRPSFGLRLIEVKEKMIWMCRCTDSSTQNYPKNK